MSSRLGELLLEDIIRRICEHTLREEGISFCEKSNNFFVFLNRVSVLKNDFYSRKIFQRPEVSPVMHNQTRLDI